MLVEKGRVERLGEDGDVTSAQQLGKGKRKAVAQIGGFDLHGDTGRQGLFMREMASYFNDFSARYYSIPLASNIAFLFKNKRIGQIKLAEIPSKCCQIEFVEAESYIEVISYPFWIANREKREGGATVSTSMELEKAAADEAYVAVEAVWSILAELNAAGGLSTGDGMQETCSYCKSAPANPIRFSVCGHLACQACFETAANHFAERQSTSEHLCCPVKSCATFVAFADVSKYSSEITKTSVLIKGIQLYSKANPDASHVVVCPSENCQTLLPKNMPYKACKGCNARVCLRCGCTDDRTHDAISADFHGRALNASVCKLAQDFRDVTDSVAASDYKACLQQLQSFGPNSVQLCKKLVAEIPACNLHMCAANHVMSAARTKMEQTICGFVQPSVGSTCQAKVRKCPNALCGAMVADHGAMNLVCGACQTMFCVGCKCVDDYVHTELSSSQQFPEATVCKIVRAANGRSMDSDSGANAIEILDAPVLQQLRDTNRLSVLSAIQAHDPDVVLCPSRQCSGIKRKSELYSRCARCHYNTCAACGLVDKDGT